MNSNRLSILLTAAFVGLWMHSQPKQAESYAPSSVAEVATIPAPVETVETVETHDAEPQEGTTPGTTPEVHFPSVALIDEDVLESGQTVESAAVEEPEPGVEPESPEVEAVPVEVEGTDRTTGRKVTASGWGVPIGGGRVATVAHLVEGISVTRVTVAGKEGRLYRHRNHQVDAALVVERSVRRTQPFRRANYMERAYIHAKKSGRVMCGMVSVTGPVWTVSLFENETGIEHGDSGSPIVSESGEVIGIVTGYKVGDPSRDDLDTADPRIVHFVPVYELQLPQQTVASGMSPVPAATAPPAAGTPSPHSPAQGEQLTCPDGQCQRAPMVNQVYQPPVRQWQVQRRVIRYR